MQWFQKQTSICHLFSISIHQMILAPLGPNRSSSVHQSVIGLSRDKTRCTTAGLKHNTCKHYRYSTIVLLFFYSGLKEIESSTQEGKNIKELLEHQGVKVVKTKFSFFTDLLQWLLTTWCRCNTIGCRQTTNLCSNKSQK